MDLHHRTAVAYTSEESAEAELLCVLNLPKCKLNSISHFFAQLVVHPWFPSFLHCFLLHESSCWFSPFLPFRYVINAKTEAMGGSFWEFLGLQLYAQRSLDGRKATLWVTKNLFYSAASPVAIGKYKGEA